MRAYVYDLIERVLATYVESFCGLLLASLLNAPGLVALSLVEKAAVAALPAALAVIKASVGGLIGNPSSAAVLPESADPVQVVPAAPAITSSSPFVPPEKYPTAPRKAKPVSRPRRAARK